MSIELSRIQLSTVQLTPTVRAHLGHLLLVESLAVGVGNSRILMRRTFSLKKRKMESAIFQTRRRMRIPPPVWQRVEW